VECLQNANKKLGLPIHEQKKNKIYPKITKETINGLFHHNKLFVKIVAAEYIIVGCFSPQGNSVN